MTRPRPRAASLAAPRPNSQARLALLTGGVMLASMSLSGLGLAMARADEKDDRRSRQYKIGAAVLGAGALYYGLKKKNPIGTVVTGAGAYYAYKKSQENKQKSQRDRYGSNRPFPGSDNGVYPDDDGYAYDNNYPDREPRRGRGRGNRNNRGGRGNDGGFPVGGYEVPGDAFPGGFPTDVLGDDYGSIGDIGGGDYAQNDEYPDYGLNGLRARRGSQGKAAQNGPRNRRIVVK